MDAVVFLSSCGAPCRRYCKQSTFDIVDLSVRGVLTRSTRLSSAEDDDGGAPYPHRTISGSFGNTVHFANRAHGIETQVLYWQRHSLGLALKSMNIWSPLQPGGSRKNPYMRAWRTKQLEKRNLKKQVRQRFPRAKRWNTYKLHTYMSAFVEKRKQQSAVFCMQHHIE